MRGITPVNCNYVADNRVGSKMVRVPLDFTLVLPAPDGRLVIDLGQEYNSGQLGPAQALYMDLTDYPTGRYHVEVYFETANQSIKFLAGTQSLLPYLGTGMGRIYVWLVDGITPVLTPLAAAYLAEMFVLNMKQPYFVSQPDQNIPGVHWIGGNGAGLPPFNTILAGGISQVVFPALTQPIVKWMVGNPVAAVEPLYVDFNTPATVASYAVMPGEKWVIDFDPPLVMLMNVMAATAGHAFTAEFITRN